MGQRIRTAAPMGDWRSLEATCGVSAGYSQYDIVLVQETVGVIYFEASVAFGERFQLVYHCEKIIVDKVVGTGLGFLPGDKVYWSGTDGDPVTPTWQSGYYWIGIATEPAAWNEDEVEIDLKGDKATVGA